MQAQTRDNFLLLTFYEGEVSFSEVPIQVILSLEDEEIRKIQSSLNGNECLNPWDIQSERIQPETGISPTLAGCDGGGGRRPGGNVLQTLEFLSPSLKSTESLYVIPIHDKATRHKGGGDTRKGDGAGNGLGIGKSGDPSPTLTAGDRHFVAHCCSVHQNQLGELRVGDVANTLNTNSNTTGRNAPIVLAPATGFNGWRSVTGTLEFAENRAPCLQATMPSDVLEALDVTPPEENEAVCIAYVVRRFVPVETERLMGFPDGWTEYGISKKGKEEIKDGKRYAMMGNSVAIPIVEFLMKGIARAEERRGQ